MMNMRDSLEVSASEKQVPNQSGESTYSLFSQSPWPLGFNQDPPKQRQLLAQQPQQQLYQQNQQYQQLGTPQQQQLQQLQQQQLQQQQQLKQQQQQQLQGQCGENNGAEI